MAGSDQGEKTEAPTEQKREDFRKRGQVAQTKELASALVLFAGLFVMYFLGQYFFSQLHQVMTRSFGEYIVLAGRGDSGLTALNFAVNKVFLLVGPILAVMWVTSMMSSIVQVGIVNNEEALQIKWDRLNPVSGLGRIFSLKSVMDGIKAILKLLCVAGISYLVIRDEVVTLPLWVHDSIGQLLLRVQSLVFRLFGGVGLFMVSLAGLDFWYQKWDIEQKMKMSKEEVKQEHKSKEGDPLIKARIRKTQREMSHRRMMQDVPKADVIITNPTHISVAIVYNSSLAAPKVVAKGAGFIALKIRELAKVHSIPIVENKPLARTMYKSIKIGQSIPKELFTAVAEVLSAVYRLRKKELS